MRQENQAAPPAVGLRTAGFTPRSRVNGPGVRVVTWVQGCNLGCPGCFNPSIHDPRGPEHPIEAVAQEILDAFTAEHHGITFSGGEPFQQAVGVAAVIDAVRAHRPGVHVMIYSGYTLEELRGPQAPEGAAQLLARIDMLIDGRFEVKQAEKSMTFRASSNQRIWVLGQPPPIWTRPGGTEIQVLESGAVVLSGLPNAGLRRAVSRLG